MAVKVEHANQSVGITSSHLFTPDATHPSPASSCSHKIASLPRRSPHPSQTTSPYKSTSTPVNPFVHSVKSGDTAANTLATPPYPSPLPLLPLAPPHAASLRQHLTRRRSSYPPATTPGSSAGFPWVIGGTPNGRTIEYTVASSPSGFGTEIPGMPWTPGWDSLLNLGAPQPAKASLGTDANDHARAKSEPRADAKTGELKTKPTMSISVPPMSPGKIAQFGADLAWKTILASMVEVDGVGEIGVCRVLQEVWKRGGGDLVTAQCLWPSIIISLSLQPAPSHQDVRIPTPSAQASMALQELYNLTLRHWEPVIFSGLLSSYAASASPSAIRDPAPAYHASGIATPTYGPATPTKEMDLSLWTNLTPGLGDLSSLFTAPTGSTPKPSNLGQFEFHGDFDIPLGRNSISESVKGLDELFASLEEGAEANEREREQAAASAGEIPLFSAPSQTPSLPGPNSSRQSSTYQFPTPPDTDSDLITRDHARAVSVSESRKASIALSPDSMASPFVTASSNATSIVSSQLDLRPVAGPSRAAHPTSVPMPTAAFVPPPPMCMFFNPSFKDLQKGKVGVWKGDLNLKGKGGGTFSILIVGEETTGHMWQSHTWPTNISYPPDESDSMDSACTSKMIPVSYLAREGYTPLTMGMVLCNDPAIEKYVAMVQNLHSEGVAFHLPNPARLPIVFLPAKFDSSDPLQRLGVALMTKPGATLPIPTASVSATSAKDKDGEPKRKKRRQSAPSKVGAGPTHKRRTSPNVRGGNPSESRAVLLGEEVIEEE